MTEEYVKIAVEMIESGPLKDDRVLVVFLPDCHESIAGIIAGKNPGTLLSSDLCADPRRRGRKGQRAFD